MLQLQLVRPGMVACGTAWSVYTTACWQTWPRNPLTRKVVTVTVISWLWSSECYSLRCFISASCFARFFQFSADRANGRAYATVLCLSVVCDLCIVAKQCILPVNCLKKQIGSSLLGIESMVTCPVTSRDPEMSCSWPQYAYASIENSWRCYIATVANY